MANQMKTQSEIADELDNAYLDLRGALPKDRIYQDFFNSEHALRTIQTLRWVLNLSPKSDHEIVVELGA